MFGKIVSRLLSYKRVGGVEIELDGSAISSIQVIVALREGEKIQIDKRIRVNDLSELKNLPKGIPYCLNISGNRVIHRKLRIQDIQTPVRSVFPNAKEEEFYSQVNESESGSAWVSLVRKEHADEICNRIRSLGYSLIELTLGPVVIGPLLPVIKSSQEITIGRYQICHDNSAILDLVNAVDHRSFNLRCGNEDMNNTELPAFSIACMKLAGIDFNSTDSTALSFEKEEFLRKQIFKTAGWAMLIIFFLLLQVNYFLFDHFSNRKEEIHTELILNRDELVKYNSLLAEYEQKEKFFDQAGILESSIVSYYSEQLSIDVPSSIRFVEMQIYPAVKKLSGESVSVSFTPKTINLVGFSDRTTVLNEWIKTIKKKTWVREVVLMNYHHEKDKRQGEFKLEIKL